MNPSDLYNYDFKESENGLYLPDKDIQTAPTSLESNYITTTPPGYREDEVFSPVRYNIKEDRIEFTDCIFINTKLLTESADHFRKFGTYTKAHPVFDKREYQNFWDVEEQKRRNGVVLPGGVVVKENGVWKTRKVWVTGEHYGYLNYARIQLTEDEYGIVSKSKARNKKEDFPAFWDWDYVYFHIRKLARLLGKHLCVGKARRKGYSFKNGWCASNTYDLIPNRTTIIGAYLMKYISGQSGMMTMAKTNLDFLNTHTDWYKGRLNNSVEMLKSGYKLEGEQEERGFKSKIIALSFESNVDNAIGKDGEEVYFEEAGSFPNLGEVLDITIPTMEDGGYVTGMLTVFGTGGSKDANWDVFERLYYQPKLYNMLACENIWDDNASGTTCAFFHPYSKNLVPFVDEDGNSQTTAAKVYLENEYEHHKTIEKDPLKLVIWKGQRADKPEEAFAKSADNFFYRPELEAHYKNIKNNSVFNQARRLGYFENGKFVEGDKYPPIDRFPLRSVNNMSGCYIEFQPPFRDPKTGKIPAELYRLWNDPVAVDKDKKSLSLRDSLGVTYVYERLNNFTPSRGDVIIGIYVGRPLLTDDYNNQMFQLCEYVNGKIFFENDQGEVYPYAKRIKAVHRLVEEPDLLWAKEVVGKSGRTYGMSMNHNDKRKRMGATLLKNWLYTKRGVDAYGNIKYNFHYIRDIGTLEELLKWKLEGNFDRVSALLIGMYDIQETLFIPQENTESDSETDDFFDRKLF